jgi:nucleotide-binding universal stress UspA family protein
MTTEEKLSYKNILIAVDESENSRRAVRYVAQLLGGVGGFKVSILHVIPQPEEDFFNTPADRETWLIRYREKVDAMLANYRKILVDAGFLPDDVSVRFPLRYCPSMAECILAERDETDCGTIVVGRHGLSRSEEFIFGSISSKIVSHARNCAVWVVE